MVWSVLCFVLGYLACLLFSPSLHEVEKTSISPVSTQGSKQGHTTLVFEPAAEVPINHPGPEGAPSRVLKQVPSSRVWTGAVFRATQMAVSAISETLLPSRLPFRQVVIDGKDAGIPGLVHLSLVDFGDGGHAGGEALDFPAHAHGPGFHEVFLVRAGRAHRPCQFDACLGGGVCGGGGTALSAQPCPSRYQLSSNISACRRLSRVLPQSHDRHPNKQNTLPPPNSKTLNAPAVASSSSAHCLHHRYKMLGTPL